MKATLSISSSLRSGPDLQPAGSAGRPVASDDLPLDVADWDGAEHTAVDRRSASIVSQGPDRTIGDWVVGFGAHRPVGPRIGEDAAVDEDLPVSRGDTFVGESDHSFDDESIRIRRVREYNNVTTCRDAALTLCDHPVIWFERRPHRIIDDGESTRHAAHRCSPDHRDTSGRGYQTPLADMPSSAQNECTERTPEMVSLRRVG